MEKNLKKNIYIYSHIFKKLNHFAVHLKLTQFCKSNILLFLLISYLLIVCPYVQYE